MARINFTNNINVSAQVGDTLFYHVGIGDAGTELGAITAVGSNFVEIDSANVLALPIILGFLSYRFSIYFCFFSGLSF